MTLRRLRGKQQEGILKSPDNLFLSPKAKLSYPELPPNSQLHDLHSKSKGKHKLKMHIFRKNIQNEELTPPPPKETLKTYSSFGTLPQEGEKPKFNARNFLA